MDRFSVVITGAGSHHSAQSTDVDAMLVAFVAQLRASGHADVVCKLTANAREERIEPALAAPPAQLAELAVLVAKSEAATDSQASKRAPRES